MGIGTSIFLIAVGAILRYAVKDSFDAIDLQVVGLILIVAGAALIMALLDRYPILVWAGAALLGWIVGEVIATDPVVQGYLEPRFGPEGFHYIVLFSALVGAILVLVVGGLWRRSKQTAQAQKVGAAE
jgi:predicted tellurium resistance membrane protein TerC